MRYFIFILFVLFFSQHVFGQDDPFSKLKQFGNRGNPSGSGNSSSGGRKDSAALGFEHRDDSKDSLNLTFKVLDSVRNGRLDCVINDFDKYFSVPSSYTYLGNNGLAAYALIYKPFLKAGWDAGFHGFDIYKFKLEETRFYKTNRPYSQFSYQLATGKEQMIKAFHTQSPKPNWNFGFDYRLVNAPGLFITQNTNHSSYRLFSNYSGKRKRYNNIIILQGNRIKASENGGIQNDTLLSDKNRKQRFAVPVNLGNKAEGQFNPFNTTVNTGNIFKELTFFVRQSYDIGKRDSVAINDTTTEYLFYPKLRVQHTFTYQTNNYLYNDYRADSTIYKNWYNINSSQKIDTVLFEDKWKFISNDISLIQFPDTKNQAQFIAVGARLENIVGQFKTAKQKLYNVAVHFDYRNKTRNKLWDLLLKGEFYATGFNAGDYTAQAFVSRYLNKKFGNIQLFFINTNRTPSFQFNAASSFNLNNTTLNKKENVISFGVTATNPLFTLSFKNHLINNYTYFTTYYKAEQYSRPINLLQISAFKNFKLSKKWNLYSDVTLQQTDGASPIKVPNFFTRNRIAYEGVYFKNLNLSTGLELRYYTPFKANNYSPVMNSFMPQDSVTVSNLPDISAFLHFRIKSFTAFIRAENLNTVSFKNGFGFTNNNFSALHYPTQGFIFRLGILWGFVN